MIIHVAQVFRVLNLAAKDPPYLARIPLGESASMWVESGSLRFVSLPAVKVYYQNAMH